MYKSLSPRSIRLAIVDSEPQDYCDLLAAAGTPGVSIHFLFSGNDALLFARRWITGLWVINSRLADMSGFELAHMLRSLRPNALIFMIGDEYALADELKTLTMGMAKYLCKPLEPSWVLPNFHESCIPLPELQNGQPNWWADSAAARKKSGSRRIPNSAATGGVEEAGIEEVILPFGGAGRRPAA